MSDKIILKSNLDGIADAYIEFTGSGIRIGSNGVGVWLAADQARHLYAELGDNGLGGWTYNPQPAEPVPPVALHTAEYEELRKIIHAVELAATSGLAEVYNVIRQKEQGAVNGANFVTQDHVIELEEKLTELDRGVFTIDEKVRDLRSDMQTVRDMVNGDITRPSLASRIAKLEVGFKQEIPVDPAPKPAESDDYTTTKTNEFIDEVHRNVDTLRHVIHCLHARLLRERGKVVK